MLNILRVGDKKPGLAIRQDACVAEWGPSGVIMIYVLIDRPTAAMLAAGNVDEHGMCISAFTYSNVLTFAVKVGQLPWQDAPYNPRCQGISNLDVCDTLADGTGLTVYYILADSSDGTIINIKPFTLSTRFSNHILKEQYKLSHAEFSQREYIRNVQMIQNRYSPREIGERMKQAYYRLPPKNQRRPEA